MKIGVISDTHSYLDDKVLTYFREVDEIWHAGDVGTLDVLEKLEAFKTTRTVYGNIDGQDIRIRTQRGLIFETEGKRFLMTHIAGNPPRYNPEIRKMIAQYHPDVLICGHSHILRVEFDKKNSLLFLNPGAAGKHGFHKVRTLLRFEVEKGKIFNMEVVELGPRASLLPE